MCDPASKTERAAEKDARVQRGNAEFILETVMSRKHYSGALRDELAAVLGRVSKGHDYRPGVNYQRADQQINRQYRR